MPSVFPKIQKLSESLSAGFGYLRGDLYAVVDQGYFGELKAYF